VGRDSVDPIQATPVAVTQSQLRPTICPKNISPFSIKGPYHQVSGKCVCVCVCVCYLGGQQRPVLPRADLSVHQVSVRDGVSRLAEQHQVGLQVPTVRGGTQNIMRIVRHCRQIFVPLSCRELRGLMPRPASVHLMAH